jgi:hypothetical protein
MPWLASSWYLLAAEYDTPRAARIPRVHRRGRRTQHRLKPGRVGRNTGLQGDVRRPYHRPVPRLRQPARSRPGSLQPALTIAALILTAACGDGGGDPGGIAGDLHRLEVPLPGGANEAIWIYAAAPAAGDGLPVVVFGHGQGPASLLNCAPDRPPSDTDALEARAFADALAREGYLAVAVYYRNRGDTAPGLGALRPRDHHVLDARAFLAAARWARDHHGQGSPRAALVGTSMGSFPALWAAAPLPELADLQEGLELVTSIPSAMLGNHIANTGRGAGQLDDDDPVVRAGAIAMAAYAAVTTRAADRFVLEVTPITVESAGLADGLTAAGAVLFDRLFLAPPPAVPECDGLTDVPTPCDPACFAATFTALGAELGVTTLVAEDWLTADTLAAIRYWDPPTAVDPGPDSGNELLDLQRAISPAYALQGPLRVPRLLPLVSLGDHVVTSQVQGGNQAGDLFLARLQATGVSLPDPIPVIEHSFCGHADYHLPTRPACGWSLILDELAAAFR